MHMYVCLYICTYVCMHACICMLGCMYVYALMALRDPLQALARGHCHTLSRLHTHTHTQTHTHTRAGLPAPTNMNGPLPSTAIHYLNTCLCRHPPWQLLVRAHRPFLTFMVVLGEGPQAFTYTHGSTWGRWALSRTHGSTW